MKVLALNSVFPFKNNSFYPEGKIKKEIEFTEARDGRATETNQERNEDALRNLKLQMEVERLKRIEQKVVAHEMAHKVVGGRYTGAPSYHYTRGPDGKLYITGGEVPIDVSEEDTPEETIQKMEVVRRAALAPADPSPQDLAVAQTATLKEIKAKLELAQKRLKEMEEKSSPKKEGFHTLA